MTSLQYARALAKGLLAMEPSPIVRLRLLRDVLGSNLDQGEWRSLIEIVNQSPHVRLLADEQRDDGGWGAFHSRRSSVKRRIATTEIAVERAIHLGLDGEHPILERAKDHILSIMCGRVPFPDRHEKNDRWPTGMRMILAATLSLIDPLHDELERDRSLWREIAIRTFQSGKYAQEDETQAHAALTGASVAGSYLTINNRYAIRVLGSRAGSLPLDVERALVDWIWHHESGIRYLEVPLAENPPLGKAGALDRWFTSLEMILLAFPRSAPIAAKRLDWIWDQQDAQGLWDFGPRSTSSVFFPLADHWRRKMSRKIDWSARILLLCAAAKSAEAASKSDRC